jgi:hypothetical protein
MATNNFDNNKANDNNHLKLGFSYKLGNSETVYGDNASDFDGYQNYLPIYDKFFVMDETNCNKITLNSTYAIISLDTKIKENIYLCKTKSETESIELTPVFFKYSPLIDPIKYMGGEEEISPLPQFQDAADKNNVAYVDGFFYFLSSKLLKGHNFTNGNLFYGQHLTIKKELEIDISDEIEYLVSRDHFNDNKHQFNISEEFYNCIESFSNKNKRRLCIEISSKDENLLDDLIENIDNYEHMSELNEVFLSNANANADADADANTLIFESPMSKKNTRSDTKSTNSYDSESEDDSEDETNIVNSEIDSDGSDGSDSEGSSDDESEAPKIVARLPEFPVNMIGLECYVDTLDSYISECDIDNDEMTCILLQVIFTLIGYQKAFNFVHNDLHTNNIMYIPTEYDYIFYKYGGQNYKVKTYGKIWKIIDYGRATYQFNGEQMFSSSFAPKGDAATQYNCEPYYNPKKKPVDINYSFDLCRLACSLYEDLFGDDVVDRCDLNPIENVILDWCLDYKGRNVLIKNNGEERYEDFKLYKMIARTVHDHVPKNQLSRDIFSQHITKNTKMKKGKTKIVINIDLIPSYVERVF